MEEVLEASLKYVKNLEFPKKVDGAYLKVNKSNQLWILLRELIVCNNVIIPFELRESIIFNVCALLTVYSMMYEDYTEPNSLILEFEESSLFGNNYLKKVWEEYKQYLIEDLEELIKCFEYGSVIK